MTEPRVYPHRLYSLSLLGMSLVTMQTIERLDALVTALDDLMDGYKALIGPVFEGKLEQGCDPH